MGRLLHQNWFVACRTKLLWILCALVLIISAAARTDTHSSAVNAAPAIGVAYAFFAAAYLGEGAASGRQDGQIITGASRLQIYLADWLTVTGCCVLILLFMLAGDLLGAVLFGSLEGTFMSWLMYTLAMVCNACAWCALYVFVCVLIVGRKPGRSTTALIVCTVLLIAMMVWINVLENALMEPEFYTERDMGAVMMQMPVDDPDAVDPEELIPNPNYVGEPQRSMYSTTLDFLPIAQPLLLSDLPEAPFDWETVWEPLLIMLDCLVLTLAAGILGAALFSRRELD